MSNLRSVKRSVNPPPGGESTQSPSCITWGPKVVTPQGGEDDGVFKSSIDSLHCGFFVIWPDGPCFMDFVDNKKLEALAEHRSIVAEWPGIELPFVVHTNGRRGGYTYHISFGEVQVFLRRESMTPYTPNVFVEVGSLDCWQYGYKAVLDRIATILEDAGGAILKSKISRIDLACDFLGMPIDDTNIADSSRHITRAKENKLYRTRDTLETFHLSPGNPLSMRVYDKIVELRKKKNKAKQEYFAELWGVDEFDAQPNTRVEFQLRSDVLKEFKIITIADLEGCVQSLWDYCTQKWFRQADKPVDRENKNQSKARLSEFWQLVQSVKWTENTKNVIRKALTPHLNLEPLVKLAAGVGRSMAAFFPKQPTDIDGIIAVAQGLLETEMRIQYKNDFEKFTGKYFLKMTQAFPDLCFMPS